MREFCRGVKGILFSKLQPIVKALVLKFFYKHNTAGKRSNKKRSPANARLLLYENLPVNCPTNLHILISYLFSAIRVLCIPLLSNNCT